jgi:hypothetical protein
VTTPGFHWWLSPTILQTIIENLCCGADGRVGGGRSVPGSHDAGRFGRGPVWQAGVHSDTLLGHDIHKDWVWTQLLARLELCLGLLVLFNRVDVGVEQI